MTRAHILAAAATLVVFVRSPVQAQSRITVGPNVMVSAAKPGWEHSEYAAHADPSDANRVMVCSMHFSPAQNRLNTVIYNSFDAGKSWIVGLDDSTSRFNGVWDPACAFGVGGNAYFVTLILPDTTRRDSTEFDTHQWWVMGGDHNMHVYRSRDGGRSWGPSVDLSFIDRQTLTVDHSNGKYRGRMYIYGNNAGKGLWLIYSTDSGTTWQRSERTDVDKVWPNGGTVSPMGNLIIPISKDERPPTGPEKHAVAVSVSRDGGIHLDNPVTVADLPSTPSCDGWPTSASDHSGGPFQGRVYVIWSQEYRSRCAGYVAYSDDEGKTWSKPNRTTDERPRAHGKRAVEAPMAQIAVSPKGVVGISWYDFGEDTLGRKAKLRFTASLDGGESWQPSVLVSGYGYTVSDPPAMAPETVGLGGGARRGYGKKSDEVDVYAWPSARGNFVWNSYPGDYTGIAVGADGVFHTFWVDNRSGVGEMYSARISVDGPVTKPEAELAPLVNVTKSVEVQWTGSVWDPKARTLTWEYRLLNTSTDTIVGPLKLRVSRLESDLGVPHLVLDKGLGSVGTVLDVSSMLPAGRLMPNQTSDARKIPVRLDDVRDVMSIFQRDIVHMQLRLYANRRPGAKADSTTSR